MNLRINKSVVVEGISASIDIEVQNLDQFLDENPNPGLEFVRNAD